MVPSLVPIEEGFWPREGSLGADKSYGNAVDIHLTSKHTVYGEKILWVGPIFACPCVMPLLLFGFLILNSSENKNFVAYSISASL